jgi:hypothetical protein
MRQNNRGRKIPLSQRVAAIFAAELEPNLSLHCSMCLRIVEDGAINLAITMIPAIS